MSKQDVTVPRVTAVKYRHGITYSIHKVSVRSCRLILKNGHVHTIFISIISILSLLCTVFIRLTLQRAVVYSNFVFKCVSTTFFAVFIVFMKLCRRWNLE